MKKLTLSLLLGTSLFFGIHHTHAEETIKYEEIPFYDLRLDKTREYIYNELHYQLYEVHQTNPMGFQILIPKVPANTNFKGVIKLQGKTLSQLINYQVSSYDNLSDLNKKLFDYFKFDKKQFATIIEFDGTFTKKFYNQHYVFTNSIVCPKDGSFTVGQETKSLRWRSKSKDVWSLNLCSSFNWEPSKGFYWQE